VPDSTATEAERAEALVVLVTAPVDQAPELARALCEERLAACVNIVGDVRSIYRWQGKLCDDREALCIIKSTRDRFPALRERIVALHPYEVPEVIALPIEQGHAPYLEWLVGQVS
jgi:periplasmic divalent cation tolerance protein